MRPLRNYWTRPVLTGMLLLALLAAPRTDSSTSSGARAADTSSVTITEAQSDSLTTALVNLQFEVDSLMVRNWQLRQFAGVDSVRYERLMELYRDERGSWLERVVKSPELWLLLGLWLGVAAGR